MIKTIAILYSKYPNENDVVTIHGLPFFDKNAEDIKVMVEIEKIQVESLCVSITELLGFEVLTEQPLKKKIEDAWEKTKWLLRATQYQAQYLNTVSSMPKTREKNKVYEIQTKSLASLQKSTKEEFLNLVSLLEEAEDKERKARSLTPRTFKVRHVREWDVEIISGLPDDEAANMAIDYLDENSSPKYEDWTAFGPFKSKPSAGKSVTKMAEKEVVIPKNKKARK